MKTCISVERVCKYFDRGRKCAVNELSFSVGQGEIFGLLGPNGAGKTTTLRMLGTLLTPDSGRILIHSNDVAAYPEKTRGELGFLTSKLKLDECFTPDYLFDFFANLYGMDRQVSGKRKSQLFSKFGIHPYSRVSIGKLSDGMKQKVSLAVSVAHDPSVIIFDEPTNGLDIIASKLVTDFLIQQKAEGKTIILSTHLFDLAEKLCDRAGIIINGKLAVCGTLEELCSEKNLEEVFFEHYSNI